MDGYSQGPLSSVSYENLQATLSNQRSQIDNLEKENRNILLINGGLENQCTVLEAAVCDRGISTARSRVGDTERDLVSMSKAEWISKNETALSMIEQLESANHKLKLRLEILDDTSALPRQAEILSKEIQKLERKESCSELDICDLTVRINDLNALAVPLSKQIEESRKIRVDLNTETNRLRREIVEADSLEHALRNEVITHMTSEPHNIANAIKLTPSSRPASFRRPN